MSRLLPLSNSCLSVQGFYRLESGLGCRVSSLGVSPRSAQSNLFLYHNFSMMKCVQARGARYQTGLHWKVTSCFLSCISSWSKKLFTVQLGLKRHRSHVCVTVTVLDHNGSAHTECFWTVLTDLFFFVPSQLLLTHISVSICPHWHTVTHWAALGFKTVQMAFYTGNIAKGRLAIYKECRLLQEVQEKLFRCVPPELLTISWCLFILIS